jgi:hypothetical protein
MIGMLDLGMQILKGLAVVGGAAVGAVGSGLLLRLAARLSFQRKVPRKVLVPVRALGAVALGLAVWAWVSSSGDWGPGMGGWLGSGGSGAKIAEHDRAADESAEPKGEQDKASPGRSERASRPEQSRDSLRIDILGGARVKEERFYVLEGNKEPLTLSEVRKAIQARRQEPDKPPLKGIVIMIFGTSVARDHPAAKNLVKWAEENRLSVTFPPTSGAAP